LSALTGFKRLGFAVVALLLTIFGVLGIVSVLVPAEQVREAITAEIRAVTGLDPVLRGNVSVSLFPYGKVSFSDVTLGNRSTARRRSPPIASPRSCASSRCSPARSKSPTSHWKIRASRSWSRGRPLQLAAARGVPQPRLRPGRE
jgi:hypothetical protein